MYDTKYSATICSKFMMQSLASSRSRELTREIARDQAAKLVKSKLRLQPKTNHTCIHNSSGRSTMPSDSAKRRQQQKREKRQADQKKRAAGGSADPKPNLDSSDKAKATSGDQPSSVDSVPTNERPELASVSSSKPKDQASAAEPPAKPSPKISHKSCAGALASHPESRDLHVERLSLTFHGAELLSDAKLELNCGQRYGLLGLNGCGKSTLLSAIGEREIPMSDHMDIYHLKEEMPSSDKTPLQCVMEVDEERVRLETEAEELARRGDSDSDRLLDVYDRLEELDSTTAETKAARILFGLGFNSEMQHRKCSDFSGGWRMRVSLARALFVKPHLLLLDEPTNHLDLEACVWLEDELKKYKRILVLVSHSQDFLNGVCTNIIHLFKNKLIVYGGNYDAYVKTRHELEEHQMKRYHWERNQMQHMKDYIARFGRGQSAKQAQSKEKVLSKMIAGGLTERVANDQVVSFTFPDCGSLHPPVIMVQAVSFQYGPDLPMIYNNIEFGVDLDTRVALVGPNGAGKSTLLKLLDGDLVPTDGLIRRHAHLKTGRYHQHLKDHLDLDMSALDYMMKCYPEEKELEQMRRSLGRYGLTGKQQVCPMRNLSDGQRCRVTFAWLAFRRPHLLLLDEPTNHLDIETIDALAEAINCFEGGMLLVSHDFRLISQVAKEIWVCRDKKVTQWRGDILSYKEKLKKKVNKAIQEFK